MIFLRKVPLFIVFMVVIFNSAHAAITDCVGETLESDPIKGIAECTSPEPTPWEYRICRDTAEGAPAFAIWCTSGGGTWNGSSCDNPNPAPLTDVFARAQAFVTVANDPCTMNSTDTGWGAVFDASWNCGMSINAPHEYYSWNNIPSTIITKSLRSMGFSGQKSLNNSCINTYSDQSFRASRERSAKCPLGSSPRANTSSDPGKNGKLECFKMPAQEDPCNRTKKPVDPASGEKFLYETDYQGGEPLLKFSRYYRSYGFFRPLDNANSENLMLGRRWHSTYDRHVYINEGSSDLLAMVLRENGSVEFFGHDGLSVRGGSARLEKLYDQDSVFSGWIYIADDGIKEIYDSDGYIKKITKNERGISIQYNENRKIISVSSDSGKNIIFSYNENGFLSAMTDPAGYTYQYQYSVDGLRLTSVIYPDDTPLINTDNPKKNYHYEAGNNQRQYLLTGITDELNVRFSTYAYDSSGRVSQSHHGSGASKIGDSFTYTYDPSTEITYTNVVDEIGGISVFGTKVKSGARRGISRSFPSNSCSSDTKNREYNLNGDVASRESFSGQTTIYEYNDSYRRRTASTEGSGTPEERVVTASWHPTFNLPVTVTEPGLETSYVYDSYGNVASKTLKDLNDNDTMTWSTNYVYSQVPSAPGLIIEKTVDGPKGGSSDETTYYYYDANETCAGGHNGCRGQLKQIKNPLNQNVLFDKYNANGQLEEMTDINGIITTMTYSPRGWLLSVSRNAGSITPVTTMYEYYPTGLLKKVTNPDGDWIQYSYNDAHELIGIQNHKSESIEIVRNIDATAHTKTVVKSFKSSSDQEIKKVTNILGRNDLLFEQVGNSGQKTEYIYDSGNRLKEVLQHGFDVGSDTLLTEYEFNQNTGLVEKEYLPKKDGASVRGTGDFISYGYDANRRLASISNVNDSATSRHTFTYDGFGRLVNEWSPQTGNINYWYSSNGTLSKKLVGAGSASEATIRYQFDILNRLTAMGEGTAAGGGITWTHHWHYDDATPGNYGIGRLAYTTDPSGRTDYTYDALGRIASEQRQINIPGGGTAVATTSFAYSPGGRLIQVTYPGGRVVDYTQMNHDVTAVATQSGANTRNIYSGINYQAFGGWNQISLPEYSNGYFARTFDLDGRLQKWEVLDVEATSTDVYRDYTYDKFNNITSITYSDDPVQNQVFSYDEQQRLLGAQDQQGIWGYSYKNTNGLDTLGDRTRRTLQRIDPATELGAQVNGQTYYVLDENYTYANNRLVGVTRDVKQYPCNASDPSRTGTPPIPCDSPSNVRTMTYDARGNLVTDDRGDDQGITLQYDVYGRLIQASGMQE